MRKTSLAPLVSAFALAVLVQPAVAQDNAPDRLQQCRSERTALAEIQARLTATGYLSDEEIARYRAARSAARRQAAAYYQASTSSQNFCSILSVETYRTRQLTRLRDIGRSVSVNCPADSDNVDNACPLAIPGVIESRIDRAEAARRDAVPLLGQADFYRSNLAAHSCG